MPKLLSREVGVGGSHNDWVDATPGFRLGDASKPSWTAGTGTPEGAVTAPIGSIFSRIDGGADTAIYRKESGTGNTGWVAVTNSGTGGGAVASVDGRTGTVVLSDLYVDVTGDNMTGSLGLGVPVPTAKLHFSAATNAVGGILFGTDTNLYRAGVDHLKTDDSLTVTGTLNVNTALTAPILTGTQNTSSLSAFAAGTALTAKQLNSTPNNWTELAFVTTGGINGGIAVKNTNPASRYGEMYFYGRSTAGFFPRLRIPETGGLDIYGDANSIVVNATNTGILAATGGIRLGDSSKPTWTSGVGSPEGAVMAPIGSLYSRTDGSTNTSVYRKEAGTGITGWVATGTVVGGVTSVDGRSGAVTLSDLYVDVAGDTMTGVLTAPSVALGASPAGFGDLRLSNGALINVAAGNNFSLGIGGTSLVNLNSTAGLQMSTTLTMAVPGASIEMNKNELRNPVSHKLGIPPASPVEGQWYYDTTLKDERFWNGTSWVSSGTSADLYVNTAGDTMTGDLYAPDYRLNAAKYEGIGQVYDKSLYPFMLGTWADRLQHATISNCEYWTGSAWTGLASSTVQEIFSGHPANTTNLNSTTYPKWRVTFSGVSSSYAGMLFLYNEYSGGNPRGFKVTLEDSTDGSTWNVLLAETTVGDGAYYSTIPTGICYSAYIRLTVEHTTAAQNYAWKQIRFFSDRMNGQGGQQLGLPFSWNYAKQVTFPARVDVSTGVRLEPTGQVRSANAILPTVGGEMLTNPNFDTDLTGWTVGAGWAWLVAAAKHTTGNVATLSQTITTVNGGLYKVGFVMTGRTAGSVTVGFGAYPNAISAGSSWTTTIRATSTSSILTITPTTDFDGSIDSMTVTGIGTYRTPQMTLDSSLGTSVVDMVGQGGSVIGIGQGALRVVGTPGAGANNIVAVGQLAGSEVIGCDSVVLIGDLAGRYSDSIYRDVFIGQAAGQNLRNNVNDTTLVGFLANGTGTGGGGTTAVGSYVLENNAGGLNTAVGNFAGRLVTTGSNYTAVGWRTGYDVTTAALGTYIGSQANITGAQADGQTALGYGVICGGANSTALGRSTSATGAGSVAIGTSSAGTGAATAVANEIMLGTTAHNVRVPNTMLISGLVTFSDVVADKITYWTGGGAYKTGIASGLLFHDVPVSAAHEFRVAGVSKVKIDNTGMDLQKNEIRNAVTHKLGFAPASPVEGQRYYDTTTKAERYYDGAKWITPTEVWIGTDAPAGTTAAGDFWYDTDDVSTFVLPMSVANGGTGGTSPTMARSSLSVPYVGNSTTTAGGPTTGTYARGDHWLDSSNVLWVCTVAGSPGTWVPPVGYELAYAQITATVTITATTYATAQLVINSGTRNYDGSPIMIEFFAEYVEAPNGQWIVGELYDGATDIAQHWEVGPGWAASTTGGGAFGSRRLTPTPGSHNYQMRVWNTAGTGKVDAGTGVTGAVNAPAYLRITQA